MVHIEGLADDDQVRVGDTTYPVAKLKELLIIAEESPTVDTVNSLRTKVQEFGRRVYRAARAHDAEANRGDRKADAISDELFRLLRMYEQTFDVRIRE